MCITTGRMYLLVAALLRKSSWLDPYASIFMCLETYRPLRFFFFFFEIHAAQYQYLLPVLFGVIAQPSHI